MSNFVFTTKNPQTKQEITIRPERVEERTAVENLVRESCPRNYPRRRSQWT